MDYLFVDLNKQICVNLYYICVFMKQPHVHCMCAFVSLCTLNGHRHIKTRLSVANSAQKLILSPTRVIQMNTCHIFEVRVSPAKSDSHWNLKQVELI